MNMGIMIIVVIVIFIELIYFYVGDCCLYYFSCNFFFYIIVDYLVVGVFLELGKIIFEEVLSYLMCFVVNFCLGGRGKV